MPCRRCSSSRPPTSLTPQPLPRHLRAQPAARRRRMWGAAPSRHGQRRRARAMRTRRASPISDSVECRDRVIPASSHPRRQERRGDRAAQLFAHSSWRSRRRADPMAGRQGFVAPRARSRGARNVASRSPNGARRQVATSPSRQGAPPGARAAGLRSSRRSAAVGVRDRQAAVLAERLRRDPHARWRLPALVLGEVDQPRDTAHDRLVEAAPR